MERLKEEKGKTGTTLAENFIQNLKILQDKISDIKKQIAVLAEEENDLMQQFRKLHNRERDETEQFFPASVENFVSLIRENQIPEIIPVWKRGENEVVLLRSKNMPEFAFVVWRFIDKSINNPEEFISLDINGTPSPRFFIVCAGCFYKINSRDPLSPLSEEQKEEIKKRSGYEFGESLCHVCFENGVRNIFMARPKEWAFGELKDRGIGLHDAREYMKIMSISYSKLLVESNFNFINWKGSTIAQAKKFAVY